MPKREIIKRDITREQGATGKPCMAMSDDIEWQERYNLNAQLLPYIWTDKAKELLYCAGIIYENANPFEGMHETSKQYFMLTAYAFENLLKGLILLKEKKQGMTFEVGKLLHHKLIRLARESGLTCTEDELHLLKSLEFFGVILGRYPLPKNWKELKKQPGVTYSSHDINRIVNLVHKIEAQYKTLDIELDIYDWSYYLNSSNGKATRVERKINVPHYPRYNTREP